jgi:hypothetical protein
MIEWADSFADDSPDHICNFYDSQASLWGTFSPIKRDSSTLIKNYFESLFIYQNRQVSFDNIDIRFIDQFAISNGLYTFEWLDNGSKITKQARFSFIFINKAGEWLIAEHHSSALP